MSERSMPGFEVLRDREMGRILRGILKVRLSFLLVVAVFLSLIVIYDLTLWKLVALGVVVSLQLTVVVFDAIRLRRSEEYATRYMPLDLLLIVLLQTGFMVLTGGLESPLVVIYIPVGMIAGVNLGPTRIKWAIIALITALLWGMTLLGLAGWMPRTTPLFLDMGPGFLDRPIYAVTNAAILTMVVLLGSVVGAIVHKAIRRMLEQAIGARQQALETLADRNRELTYLSGAIAHELKNPLASIQGLVQLLDRPPKNGTVERQAARMEVLRKEVSRMRETLDEFLNFSRPLGELTVEAVQPATLLDDVASLHEGLARARLITLSQSVKIDEPISSDPRKLKQALVNLLQNALEAVGDGGRVMLLARPGPDGTVEIGVSDNGPGVDPQILERVTEAGVTKKSGGSGIGLAVTRAIAEQHGGRLVVENLPTGGCQALLQIPREAPTEAAEKEQIP